jgi:hypothetical protein
MQLGSDSDGQQKYLSGLGGETPEAVLKKIQAFKHKIRWEGFIDEEGGLCRMRCLACKQAFSATNPGQTPCKGFRVHSRRQS